jgi:hypothetical protein
MHLPVNLYFTIENQKYDPTIKIILNGNTVVETVDTSIINEYGHIPVSFDAELQETNILEISVENNTGSISIAEAVIDNIKLAFVLFLVTKNSENEIATQLISDGSLFVTIKTPIWSWWCDRMESFNYDDYQFS